MTDYDKLKALLTEFGVGFTEIEEDGNKVIHCEEGDVKITGYGMFYTTFDFTPEGKFIKMGAWE